jgi:hypothetical protein
LTWYVATFVMSWARRLVGIARGGEGFRAGEIQSLLSPIYIALSGLFTAVLAHAQMAPTAPLEEELSKLGLDVGAQAERIGTLLAQRQLARPAAANESAALTPPSHWARLVYDLEQLRETRRQLLDAYARLNEVEPALAAELEDCGRQVEGHLHRLRSMIARADPQALN